MTLTTADDRDEIDMTVTSADDRDEIVSQKHNHPSPGVYLASPMAYLGVQSDDLDRIPSGTWGAGLFDCCDVCIPNCLMAFICTAVPIAQSVAHIGMMRYAPASQLFGTLEAFCWLTTLIPGGYCINSYYHGDLNTCAPEFQLICTIVGFVAWTIFAVGAATVRYRIRQRYLIPGNAFADSISSCFCRCCVVAQIASHVKSYTPGSCSFGPPDQLDGYKV